MTTVVKHARWFRVGHYTTNSRRGAAQVAKEDREPVEVCGPGLVPTGEVWTLTAGQWQRVIPGL